MKLPKELRSNPNIKYLVPDMKFNLGTLKYEPFLPKEISDNKLPRKIKIKIWLLGIALVLILLLLFTISF